MNIKINDVISLCEIYGSNTTLGDLARKIKGKRIYKCPKCNGFGYITIKNNNYSWRTSSSNMYKDKKCDLCNGEGYTEHEYKPKMVQDGWE